ncbi:MULTISPECIES: YkvA family protein [Sphingobacterium]|uniref:DUF1232 domain-containing protein n=1 Tax=Sphingobacterium litopenaei TaxID=2763500 RepID=A0ABR7YB07_9SPHI|nr:MULTISPECIES: DUF1232 domain-containing protein [Sphingobacterium]MBD1428413.1 DUF1232 domain-containing protein [Sphingobacterium litopenaei]NGM71783.1 DUF1232 domain-containing protein [Sphingobacterium sp. SGL-16]
MKQTYLKKAFKLFSAYKAHQLTSDDLNKADAKALHLNDKMNDFKVLVNMAKDIMAGKYKVNAWNASIIVATIIYVVSPIDAIPDIIPVLGWLDDVTIVGYALSKLSEELKRYKIETASI